MTNVGKKEFSIVLTQNDWIGLRPSIKRLQKENRLSYEASTYTSGKVIVICSCVDDATEKEVDAAIESVLGYVYA